METFIVYDMHEDGKHRGGKRIVETAGNLASYIYQNKVSKIFDLIYYSD